ncbi:copper resistance protein CopC [Brevundimonas diminuta]|uniref:copper resistance protein CopC n=1 Tax=Brevundimonas diminuta TaxID=293 RepID=UPI0020935909|nr:copper resistance protein CopC [Brevundimonas diminuta]
MRYFIPFTIAAAMLASAGAASAQVADPHAGHGGMAMAAPSSASVLTSPADGSMSSSAPTAFSITFPHAMTLKSLTLTTDGGRPTAVPVQAAAGTKTTVALPALGRAIMFWPGRPRAPTATP